MTRYRSVVFLDGDDSDEAFRILNDSSAEDLLAYLMQWEYGEPSEESDREPWGNADYITEHKLGDLTYVVSWNWHLAYVSLTEVIHV